MDIEIRLLKCATALAEYGNFARASKAVHLSQPSLSRAIQELETRLGAQLFLRERNGVEPTAAGSILLEHAAEILSRTQDLAREMDLMRGLQKGELNIGAGLYPGPMFVDRAVGRLVSEHPAARVSIAYAHAGALLPQVMKRSLDLAVLYAYPRNPYPQLHVTRLCPHYIYFVARRNHPLAKHPCKLTLTDIILCPITTTAGVPPSLVKRFIAALPKRSLGGPESHRTIPSVSCESLLMMKNIAMTSDVVAILPLNVVIREVEEGELVILPFVEPWMHVTFGIVRLEHRSSSSLGNKFIELVTETDANLSDWEVETASAILGAKSSRKLRIKKTTQP